MLTEYLLALEDGSHLALTLDARPPHDPVPRNNPLAYAFEAKSNGAVRDWLPLVTEMMPADHKLSAKFLEEAKNHDQAARMYAGKKYEAHLRQSATRARLLSERALVEARRLPTGVWHLGGRMLLLEYQEHPRPRWYRIVSLDETLETARFEANDLCKAVQRKPFDVSVPAVAPLKFKVLAAKGEHFLIDGGMTRAVLRRDTGSWQRLALIECKYGGWQAGDVTATGFACEIHTEMDQHELIHFDLGSEVRVRRWPRKRKVTTGFASASPPIGRMAMGGFGGEVAIVDTNSGACEALPPFLGFGKDDAPEVRISPDGRYTLSHAPFSKRAGIFDTSMHSCAVIDAPDLEEVGGVLPGELREVRVPGFALTNTELLTLARGSITRSPLAELMWAAPPLPAPKLRKLKSPLETIAAATSSGPLRPLAGFINALYRPSIALLPTRQRGDLALGLSKFNGVPDLPQGSAWPRWQGVPMGFLAQIDCAAARAAAPELALPDAGLLSFFLGLDPDYEIPSFYSEVNHDGEGARVVYTPPGSTLGRMAVPADMPTDYLELERPVCKLKFVRGGAVLPEASNPIVAATSAFSTAQAQAYAALAELVNGDDEDSKHWGSRIGGHPAILQNDTLEIEAESLERGLDLQTGQQWNDPDFARASAQWCQLMQMASEDAAEWLWGDGGLMHWMVRQTELSTAVFTRAWAIGVN